MATTPQTNVTLAEFAEALDRFESFALCGHVSPDGDCLGSQLALAHALRAKGKRAVCLLAHNDAVDKSFLFLPGANELIPACEFEGDVDAFIAVDVPNLERLGDAARVHESAGAHFTLDHHAVESCMAEYNYVDPDAPGYGHARVAPYWRDGGRAHVRDGSVLLFGPDDRYGALSVPEHHS